MTLTEREVRNIADLANLDLTPDEARRIATELGDILTYVEKLNELDTRDVQPMAQVLYEAEPTAALRPDAERAALGQEAALANAPQCGAGYFKVPKVIEK